MLRCVQRKVAMLSFMKKIKFAQLKNLPWYPLFLGIYPVLALLGHNIAQVEPSVIWRPLAACVIGTLLVLVILRLLLRDWHRAAVGTALLVFLFFSYGHVYGNLKTVNISGFALGRYRYLVPLWVGAAILGLWWIARKMPHAQLYAPVLNLLSIFLLIYPLFQVASFTLMKERATRATASTSEAAFGLHFTSQLPPDVYYITLDSYARADILQDRYGYDNSQFLGALRAKGFYIANCSQSNYSATLLSLVSSFNMNYLDMQITSNFDSLIPQFQNSAVRKIFKGLGYRSVSIESGWVWTEWRDADVYLSLPKSGLRMNEFEAMLMQTSAGRAVMDAASRSPEKQAGELHRERILYELYELKNYIPSLRGPKFVFVHLVIPHSPFVFGPHGEAIEPILFLPPDENPTFEEYAPGYIDQVNFISTQIEQIVDVILANSSPPPIIIIQGDHGAWLGNVEENSTFNLNAYYFPNGPAGLYETITPVNTFRLVFNNYFDGHFELLEDVARWSNYGDLFNFTIIPDQCGGQ